MSSMKKERYKQHICWVHCITLVLVACVVPITHCGGSNGNHSTPTATPTPAATASPTPITAICDTCHGFPPSTGKHLKHNGSNCCLCTECHHQSVDENYNWLSLHNNGTPDVSFAHGGQWDGESCSGLAGTCHYDRYWW